MKKYVEEVALSGYSSNPPLLTPKKSYLYALSFLENILEKTGKEVNEVKIAIAQDPRLSGRLLKISCFDALVPYGVTCFDCNISTISEINALCKGILKNDLVCDGAILITSSTGSPHLNGLKFFDSNGQVAEDDFNKIIINANSTNSFDKLGTPKYIDNYKNKFGKKVYNTFEFDINKYYSLYLLDKIRNIFCDSISYEKPLLGYKIFIDASNGCGGFLANQIFANLGAYVADSINLIPDGNFFNHLPNPSDPTIRSQTSVKTISTGSDLGLLFDTDVNSFAAYDRLGLEIHDPLACDDFEEWIISNIYKIKS